MKFLESLFFNTIHYKILFVFSKWKSKSLNLIFGILVLAIPGKYCRRHILWRHSNIFTIFEQY